MVESVAAHDAGQINYLVELIESRRAHPPGRSIAGWAEKHRKYPKGSPYPGQHRNDRVPYAVEIMENMAPHSLVRLQDILKAVQLGLTAAGESVMGYYIGEMPSEILYVSSTEDLLERWVSKRLDPMLDSCDLRSLITSSTNDPGSRKTGDKTFSKQFKAGAALDMASAQSAASLRSDSKRVLILDEVDGAPIQLRTGEGKYTKVAEGRTRAWDGREKIMALSTATTYDNSEIWQRYLLGDKRQFIIPCPLCGKEQWLDHEAGDGSQHGLKPVTEAGRLVDAVYMCDYCHDAIHNHHKYRILNAGDWVPQVVTAPLHRRSYQISSLYSPFFSWMSYWQEYEEALEEPDGMRAFTNLYKGMPYRETGARPVLERVIELKGAYATGMVPDGVIYITIGVDVQRGSEKYEQGKDSDNKPRIELEIAGYGFGYRSWSIDYLVFEGAVDDPQGGAWSALREYIEKGGFEFRRSNGVVMHPGIIGVDANDHYTTAAVYEFCTGYSVMHPLRGAQELKRKKGEKRDNGGTTDQVRHSNVKRFRWIKADNDQNVLMINTAYYKNMIYQRLKKKRAPEDQDQPVGFMDFPVTYTEKYFRGLTAEERLADGSFHCPSGRRNEQLDCRVYSQCFADVYLDNLVNDLRAYAKAKGARQAQIQSIDSKYALAFLEAKLQTAA